LAGNVQIEPYDNLIIASISTRFFRPGTGTVQVFFTAVFYFFLYPITLTYI